MVKRIDSVFDTPMMRQYLSLKEKYRNEILFFRMGDFYEMFLDDAKEAAGILGIALTSRSKDKAAVPMAGVPVRAIDSYLPKLLRAGKRVAICEQTEDPKDAKGLVARDVVRVVTPGTIIDEKLIGERSNNYIASLVRGKTEIGLAWLDVSTGQFYVWESRDADAVAAQLARIEPAEFVLPEGLAFSSSKERWLENAVHETLQTPYPDMLFDRDVAHRRMTEHFGTQTLEGFGCEHLDCAIRAGGGLLHYVGSTQKEAHRHITSVRPFTSHRYVPIDRSTRQALELTESYRSADRGASLLSCFDKTASSLGGRRMRDWLLMPLTDVDEIILRQDAVEELVGDDALRSAIRELLEQIHDLERICTRMSYRSANARDLVALSRSLEILPRLDALLRGREPLLLERIRERLAVPEELGPSIAAALVPDPPLTIKDGGIIAAGYDAELDELREISTQGTHWIARFQQQEIEKTSIPSLKIGFNKVFGYYIEVTNTHHERVPSHYVRKQTLKNCERFVTADLKDYEAKVLKASDRAVELEYELFSRLRDDASRHIPAIQRAAEALAELDVLATFAVLAREREYRRPIVNDGTRLSIKDGRHPVLECAAQGEEFVPNDIELEEDRSIMVITGPNMAGKSTYIRQVAILTLLAQAGSFIPARQAEIGVVDRIFTRVGAADDLSRGQSTFMVEMSETANILNNATSKSLLVLDEVGRGTSTFDGVSLAWSITEHLATTTRARTLFATHYHELTALSETHANIRNFNFAVKEWNDDIVFLRKIVSGGTDKSYGIHVARLAGIPNRVLRRATEILSTLELQSVDLNGEDGRAQDGADPDTERHGTRDDDHAPALRQLDLFRNPNEELLREVRKLDLQNMTPLEALIVLADLQKKIV